MHGTYEDMWEVDTSTAMLRMKNGAFKEKADIKTGFMNYYFQTRISV